METFSFFKPQLRCNPCDLFFSFLLGNYNLLEAAVPPWVDSSDEETIQQQILALSAVSILWYSV